MKMMMMMIMMIAIAMNVDMLLHGSCSTRMTTVVVVVVFFCRRHLHHISWIPSPSVCMCRCIMNDFLIFDEEAE